MSAPSEFGELSGDTGFINAVHNFEAKLEKVENSIDLATKFDYYDRLTVEEKVKFDNYLAYTINSLFWMKIKLQGLDPNEHDVKNELNRVRATMQKEKQIIDRNTIRPVLDKAAAKRFIKHGLQIPRDKNSETDSAMEVQEK